jgi:glycosyltransferase involved in cell wall biosynthesis
MEVGVPCVVTDVGDPTGSFTAKDYVEPVRPKDPVDLARGIVRLLADSGLRQKRSRMGRLFLDDYGFNADTVLDRSMDTYRALMQRRHRKPGSWPANLQNYSG